MGSGPKGHEPERSEGTDGGGKVEGEKAGTEAPWAGVILPGWMPLPGESLREVFPREHQRYEVILTLFRDHPTPEPLHGVTGPDGGGDTGDRPGSGPAKETPLPHARVPNASVVGVRRSGTVLTCTLLEGSDGYASIRENPVVGLSVPGGTNWPDVFIQCALRGYGNRERELDPDHYITAETPQGTVVFPAASRTVMIGAVLGVTGSRQRDRYGVRSQRTVRIEIRALLHLPEHGEVAPAYTRVLTGGARGHTPLSPEDHLVEALVMATRIIALGRDPELAARMEHHLLSAATGAVTAGTGVLATTDTDSNPDGDPDTTADTDTGTNADARGVDGTMEKRTERIRTLAYSSSRIE